MAAFARRVGGGFGLAKGFARWAIRRRCGLELDAPISGQRALSAKAFRVAVPFAPRFGMEIGMTVDVARAGLRVVEVELPLAHRATGRDDRAASSTAAASCATSSRSMCRGADGVSAPVGPIRPMAAATLSV